VRRLAAALVALVLAGAAAHAGAHRPGDLVSYSFDDGRVETGPDTFVVFEHAKGRVDLSADFWVTPPSSVVVEDVPGDGTFPEIQGYFQEVTQGKLFIEFYLMPTQANEELNVALCGRSWFTIQPQGVAFWLFVRDGRFYHVSSWIPRVLLPEVQPFQWYRFDVVYDVDHGTYDVAVALGDDVRPLVSEHDQPNASGSPGSPVYVFSFIGDLQDRSRVRYYIDSLNIGRTDFRQPSASLAGPPAPPPRQSLVEQEIALLATELETLAGFAPQRRASVSPEVQDAYVSAFAAHVLRDPDQSLRRLHTAMAKTTTAEERAFLWNVIGLVHLRVGNLDDATHAFGEARAAAPSLAEPVLNLVLTAARRQDWVEALRLAKSSAAVFVDDDRFPLLTAKLWLALDERPAAAAALAGLDLRDEPLLDGYRLYLRVIADPAGVSPAEIAAFVDAHADDPRLQELAGDMLFAARDYRDALARYRALAEPLEHADKSVLTKLGDCADRVGDRALARRVREQLYGRL
jgi:tetratricopeptide (TPR) repeat protein